MFYRSFCFLLLFICLAGGALAQNATIQGKITQNGEPAVGAGVRLSREGSYVAGQNVDEQGEFAFQGLDAGSYELVVYYAGERKDTVTISGLGSGEVRPLGKISIGGVRRLKGFDIISGEELIKQDETTTSTQLGSEDVRLNPSRDLGSVASRAAGVYQPDDGSSLNIRGGRSNATEIYVDGVRVIGGADMSQAAIQSVEVITGGTPPWYGDLTSGAIEVTTKGPSSKQTFGGEILTSEATDPYGYNLAALNASGPIIQKKNVVGGDTLKTPLLSYFIAGEYRNIDDDNPWATGMYKVKDDVKADLEENPVTLAQDGQTFVSRANFVKDSAIENVAAKRFAQQEQIRINPRLDLSVGDNAFLRFGGTFSHDTNLNLEPNSDRQRDVMFNYDNPEEFQDQTIRGYVRFQQQFDLEGSDGGGFLKKIYYNLQADYTRINQITQDRRHEDNFFDYGHVGRFESKEAELYQLVTPEDEIYNPEIGTNYYQTSGFADTAFTFSAANSSNPVLANYNEAIYDYYENNPRDLRTLVNTSLFPPFQSQDPVFTQNIVNTRDLQDRGGILNGFTNEFNNSTLNIYSLYAAPGVPHSGYTKRQNELFRGTGQATITLGEQGKNHHQVKAGFEFGQRVNRFYGLSPANLWTIGRQLTNQHLANFETDPDEIEYEEYNETFLAHADPIYNAEDQTNFDRNLRQELGLPVDSRQRINIDRLDPSQLSLDMYNANELLNNGNSLVTYYGYDHTGDQVNDPEGNFFDNEDTRPQDAFRPTYLAGYIHDKFQFNRIFLSLGVRIDRYDANQQVLKDKFVFVPSYDAGETAQRLDVELPAGISNSAQAYVNDVDNPTEVVGYREGSRWFDRNGTPVDSRQLEVGGQVQPHIREDEINFDAFKDYEPATNILPRISFSFPVTDLANFFAHYDVLAQRPQGPNLLFYSDYLFIEQNATQAINNPALRPEKTIDYEVGFNQRLDEKGNLALKLSAYYREMRDMIQIVRNQNAYPISYDSFENLDFATVKGFTAQFFTRRLGIFKTNTSYTLQFAEGTGSSFSSSRGALNGVEGFTVLRSLLPLSFDQRHTISGNVDIRWLDRPGPRGPENKGPKVFGVYPLRNLGASLTYNVGSGTPYTKNAIANPAAVQFGVNSNSRVDGTPLGNRLPWNFRLDIRVDKDFYIRDVIGGRPMRVNVYLSVLNLLDRQNVLGVYGFSGQPLSSGFLESAQGQQVIENVELSEEAFLDQYRKKEQNANNLSLPRRIRLGLQFNF